MLETALPVELMISLTVGGIAITSIYAVGAASDAPVPSTTADRLGAQTALRMAMNQLKRDISLRRYLVTPNANAPLDLRRSAAGLGASAEIRHVNG